MKRLANMYVRHVRNQDLFVSKIFLHTNVSLQQAEK